MTREEQRKEAARIRANQYSHPAEWNDCYKHWIEGAEWADANPVNYNGKAMLHILEKGVKQGKRELIDKACEWLKKWDAYRVCLEGHKDWFIEQFKKAMEG